MRTPGLSKALTALVALCLLGAAFPAAAQLRINDAITWGISPGGGHLAWISFQQLALNIFYTLLGVVVALAATAIVAGGVMYILALGDEARASRAKRVVTYAIIGLFIAGIPLLIVNIICDVLNLTTPACQSLSPPASFRNIADNITNFLLGLVVFLAFAAVVWGAVMYITALGDESRVAQAKRILLGAVIGIIIAGLYYAIITAACYVIGQSIDGEECTNNVQQFADIILSAVGIFLALLAPIAVGAIIYGAYLYITSLGQEDRAAQGKRVLLYATLGIALSIAAAIIVNVVIRLFIFI
jgi:hypothetical protein